MAAWCVHADVDGTPVERPRAPGLALCLQDAGGAHLVNECIRAADGKLYLFYRRAFLEVGPAPEAYQTVVANALEALEIACETCGIVVMFAAIGENAMAGLCDGQRVILVDPSVKNVFGHPGWKFVFFHEAGHHFCGHLERVCTPECELQADTFAGAALRGIGISLGDALSVLPLLAGSGAGAYPDLPERAIAISTGWMDPETAKRCGVPSGQ